MKDYKIIYKAEVTMVVTASSEKAAFNKAQKASLKIANEDKIFLEPIEDRITISIVDRHD